MKINKIKLQGQDGLYDIYFNDKLKFSDITAANFEDTNETAYKFAKCVVQELSKSNKTEFIDETTRGKLEQLAKRKAEAIPA